ncbi:MAG: response regulator [Caulobacteraceae bacterium]|nr:response regulator [Caulobacter sp.]
MSPSADGCALLVVDDQEFQLKLMGLLLSQAFPQARIVTALDAQAALAACDAQDFDCVLCDYQMPGMDGLTLAARLRETRPHLAFVLCTGGGDEMLAAEAMTSGVTQYLPKTRVSPDSLRRTISHAMQIMRQSRQIAEQREELEHFANALAHDFKQPIRQIGAFSGLIQQALPPDADPELALHFRYLREAATRLGRLVDVMSQYAILGQRPELGRVDLAEACRHVQSLLAGFLAERDAQVTIKGEAEVLGNEPLITQVLQNLVVNGVKYNRAPRPRVRILLQATDDRRLVTVSDNGIGVAADQLERIFQPLVRLHTGAAFEGTGLGLAMTRKAVAAQGGKVWCRSQPGEGSDFFVDLPAWIDARHGEPRAA